MSLGALSRSKSRQNALRDSTVVSPIAMPGLSDGGAWISRLRVHTWRLGDGLVVTTPSGQMRDLNCDVRGFRKQAFEEICACLAP
jgi:hypothetical protein